MSDLTLHIAIPAMDELEFLPHTMQALAEQKCDCRFSVYVCVNQPDEWWNDSENIEVCRHNSQTMDWLQTVDNIDLTVLDFSSAGKGWIGKRHGVGWARKMLFNHILTIAKADDILVSLDADTLFSKDYLQSIADNFNQNPGLNTISIPYYHRLTDDDRANRAILRYELYLRLWFLNMHNINSPYAFTAIGSAIAVKISALRKIGGITPMKSGEDFYLVQKLRKMSEVSNYNREVVYPAARFSDRVCFGTGPAMIKGDAGDWGSYPIYHHSLFGDIAATYNLIPQLFTENINTPFLDFLSKQFNDPDFLTPLRKNSKNITRFARAFHEKADGLRILQYVKQKNENLSYSDEESVRDNFRHFFGEKSPDFITSPFILTNLSTEQLAQLRDMLFEEEQKIRRGNDTVLGD
ncbi:hypothetical protein LJC68_02540 [Bacteroidales bacterium OttesenSCG-928-B11]|nr:hypothetical protein [Bacteroidales bacterium OttesenSCG-928-C03]MDL2311740.1 hypothetical protein [Bacteroidales bacterium OttesenSCG-928-B11]MDL2325446.1 hypothetical protein [Bacteroidales bacterium OttesenSCG-928-A14]